MYIVSDRPILECQDCGGFVRYLTPGEEQMVAAHPYNYIAYCYHCQIVIQNELLGDL